jgi:hypothetical protein
MTYLDISESVSLEDYNRVMNSLLEQIEEWRLDRGDCTDTYLFVGQLTTSFSWNRYGHNESISRSGYSGCMDIVPPPTGELRAADLRDVRGRVLRFTRTKPDYLSVTKADEFLTGAGLAPYAAETPAETPRYGISVTGYLTTSELTEAQIGEKIRRFMTRTLGITDPDIYVALQAPRRNRRITIPEAETVRLLPNKSAAYNNEMTL